MSRDDTVRSHHTKPEHPACEHMRLVVEVLATGEGPIQMRLQAAEPHFGRVEASDMRTRPEEHLHLRIGGPS